jgi:phosphoglycolate phosphatase-like HAD superfamily hydrolase
VREIYRGHSASSIAKILDPAFYAFNSSRKKNLMLHDGVLESFEVLRARGIKLIAHTESKLYGALDRLLRLGLLGYFSKIYCRERSKISHPDIAAGNEWLSRFSLENVRELSQHQSKPNPEVLAELCAAERISVEDTAYVGDSVARDVLMAKRAGVFAIWAAYGAKHDNGSYAALVRISHWTSDEVAQERKLSAEAALIRPDFFARTSFREVLAALSLDNDEERTAPFV